MLITTVDRFLDVSKPAPYQPALPGKQVCYLVESHNPGVYLVDAEGQTLWRVPFGHAHWSWIGRYPVGGDQLMLHAAEKGEREYFPIFFPDGRAWMELTREQAHRFTAVGWESYLQCPAGAEAVPPYAVPARRSDLTGLPPAWIGVGTLDLFYEEDVAYAERLDRSGVECELVVVDGAFHGFDIVGRTLPLARDFRDAQVAALRRGLSIGQEVARGQS